MPTSAAPLVRVLVLLLATVLLGAGLALGYLTVIAVRRSEGVFLPAGYVAVGCLAGGWYLLRLGLRG